ncbi:MAG TPA: hypothetical protein VFA43_18460 [Gemmatimonadaceae bacterium]|nr:hypothetical protein [Gemmatimonadaceae bacterium]
MSPPPDDNLLRAFDEARFGPSRTLNLRDGPTGEDAARRAEAWLRERQVSVAGEEVLVITGRGKGSEDGVPVIREAIVRLIPVLRRYGVISDAREHTAGAFIMRLATLRELVDAPRRNRRRTPAPVPRDIAVLKGIDPVTLASLRLLADHALDSFGVASKTPSFVADEMVRQFTRLVANIPDGPDRADRLREAIETALAEYE